jgi:poly(A) polymerase
MIGPATAEARLREAEWLRDPALQSVLSMLDGAAGRTRIVGGAVRDTILGHPRPPGDIDLATELLPEAVMERVRAGGLAVYPTGIEHGTVTVRADRLVLEVTTLRQDVATDGRRAVVAFGQDWHEDASRRDFTLNALYAGADGALFDPIGGLTDCINARVRFIGDPARRIAEDGLRVYRFFRFTASHGHELFEPEGLEACAAAAGSLSHLSAERIGSELKKILSLPRCAAALAQMTHFGLLDLSARTLEALASYERQVAAPYFATRLALILDAFENPQALQDAWRLPNDDMQTAASLRKAADLIEAMRLPEAVYRHLTVVTPALDLAAIRAGWSEAGKAAVRENMLAIRLQAFPLNGTDLIEMGWRPGRALGAELARLELKWIESGFALDRQTLIADARPKTDG